nr:hypothetical protein [Kibdelosporangium sp. MJ126-NF4]CTQ89196.1 hypothetical protein [Kibdelosporangium sp. MJ126-NF4]
MEKLISDRLREARAQPESSRGGSINRHEIRGVATGLVAAGALSQLDADRLLTDLDNTMRRAGWLQVVTHEVATVARISPTAMARRTGQAVQDRVSDERSSTDVPELLRVVPLVGRVINQGDVTRSFISVEVWSGMLIVRSATPRETDWTPGVTRQFHDRHLRWRAWDDQATQYRSTTMSGGGGTNTGDPVFENRTFFPGPPDEAETFTLVAEHPDYQASVELPLR